ncbi:hypothetical protein [Nocardioides nitrophenolicus]|uniref:hypothetical protein n=1 Tax=Nocardioides nitrophenolicus TaxID=60489 RepID=UPI001957275C|nr:hypothetical protein [Nocardioides nitrophenolicus]MBM7518474.1 hypothetical protein [Nocardioides nitrophenolicus]
MSRAPGTTTGALLPCNVLPFPTHLEQRASAMERTLARMVEEDVRAELRGPHLVIAHGPTGDRYFGPFASRAEAVAVADSESREWASEFPESPVTFAVAPLVRGDQLGAHDASPAYRRH